MNCCRICGQTLGGPIYTSSGVSITSVRSFSDTPLTVYICHNCYHVQKPALPFASDYYDKEYRISLESDDFDQLYDTVDKKCIYRTDYQTELVLNSINIPLNTRILDYGAGKASTLMKISAIRPDLVPYVFDVSDNYRRYWQIFPLEQQATYQIPESWKNKFSLVMAHFVLEHVEDPLMILKYVSELLSIDGYIFFTVPNVLSNPGDLIAVDHINHFSITSIKTVLQKANLSLVKFDNSIFRGASVCVARRGEDSFRTSQNDPSDFLKKTHDIVRFWLDFDQRLIEATQKYNFAPTAIFGAGVYGSYIAGKICNSVMLRCFLDNSPHLANSKHMGFPVIAPSDMPEDIKIIYSALNPSIARSILEPFRTDRITEIIYFD